MNLDQIQIPWRSEIVGDKSVWVWNNDYLISSFDIDGPLAESCKTSGVMDAVALDDTTTILICAESVWGHDHYGDKWFLVEEGLELHKNMTVLVDHSYDREVATVASGDRLLIWGRPVTFFDSDTQRKVPISPILRPQSTDLKRDVEQPNAVWYRRILIWSVLGLGYLVFRNVDARVAKLRHAKRIDALDDLSTKAVNSKRRRNVTADAAGYVSQKDLSETDYDTNGRKLFELSERLKKMERKEVRESPIYMKQTAAVFTPEKMFMGLAGWVSLFKHWGTVEKLKPREVDD